MPKENQRILGSPYMPVMDVERKKVVMPGRLAASAPRRFCKAMTNHQREVPPQDNIAIRLKDMSWTARLPIQASRPVQGPPLLILQLASIQCMLQCMLQCSVKSIIHATLWISWAPPPRFGRIQWRRTVDSFPCFQLRDAAVDGPWMLGWSGLGLGYKPLIKTLTAPIRVRRQASIDLGPILSGLSRLSISWLRF